jgi:fructosamine-3-kinase
MRNIYRRSYYALHLKRWFEFTPFETHGELWGDMVHFYMQRLTINDPDCVYRVSASDCAVQYWYKGRQITPDDAIRLGVPATENEA